MGECDYRSEHSPYGCFSPDDDEIEGFVNNDEHTLPSSSWVLFKWQLSLDGIKSRLPHEAQITLGLLAESLGG